jgi:hypothetical protein
MEQDCPVVNVNDRVKVYWPNEDKTTEKISAIITKIEKCKKAKQNSLFKYTILVENDDDCQKYHTERTTRLLHLKWKLIKVKKIKADTIAEDHMHKKQKLGTYTYV